MKQPVDNDAREGLGAATWLVGIALLTVAALVAWALWGTTP